MKQGLIIALRGSNGSGKSHILRLVFDKLVESGWKSIRPRYIETRSDGREFEGRVVSSKVEVRGAILEREGSTRRVGLATIGDTPGNLKNFFLSLFEFECDVYVCATRPSGGTVSIVNDLETKGHQVLWIEREVSEPDGAIDCLLCKKRHPNHEGSDQINADRIISLIYKAIGEPFRRNH